jgi:hypothetical protein
MFQAPNTKNQMIKITQLPSFANNHNPHKLSTFASPSKQLLLKKAAEIKQKAAFQCFNFVEAEVRRKKSPLCRDKK